MTDSPSQDSARWLPKAEFQTLMDRLSEDGFTVIGPRVEEGAIVLGQIGHVTDLPRGVTDQQTPGRYRLAMADSGGYFEHVNGPQSLKPLFFPPRVTVLEVLRVRNSWTASVPEPPHPKHAVLGVRSCDLHALAIQDRVFLGGTHRDPEYAARREGLFLVAVECGRSASTCFCVSMSTGPAVTSGADIILTELPEGFVVRFGSERGAALIARLPTQSCSEADLEAARESPRRAASQQSRSLNSSTVRSTLMNNLEHARWDDVARRCLACANCTMVCPTCFCSTVDEVSDLTGDRVSRERVWESCFNEEHSWTAGGAVHSSVKSRYRQWLTHKLATWHDQFGTSGCVGCGRCITWCPVGIDITEEVRAMEGGSS